MPPGFADHGRPFALHFDYRGRDVGVEELGELVLNERRFVLLGRAGAGKTVAAARTISQCSDTIPTYLIGQPNWIRELSDRLLAADPNASVDSWRVGLDTLLRGATSDLTIDQLQAIAEVNEVLLVVDGINQGSTPVASRVLDILDESLRHLQSIAVMVTDRSMTRYPNGGRWKVARALDLDDEAARQQLDEKFGVGTWSRLSLPARTLLRSPFFLDLALRGADFTSYSRSAALADFIANQASIDESAVRETASATASAFANGERIIPTGDLSSSTCASLEDAGIASRDTFAGTTLTFSHELFGDYFASLHLAAAADGWAPAELDAITFSGDRWRFDGLSADTETFDAITLAAEEMPVTAGDAYLRAVYDWNWRAAVACLGATDPTDGPFTSAARTVVLSLLSERRTDPVDGTRIRASGLLRALPDPLAHDLVTGPENEGRKIIARCASEAPWFAAWQAMFCREDTQPWSEVELDAIYSADALLGWTVSYALKRTAIPEVACQRLEGGYRGAASTGESGLSASIRWRIVHSLGAADSARGLRFLVSVLDDDPYPWVRWGAARSITEFAARSNDPALTEQAVQELTRRVSGLPTSVAKEIAWAAQYRGALGHFPSAIRPLLILFQGKAVGDVARASWDEWIARFDRFWSTTEVS